MSEKAYCSVCGAHTTLIEWMCRECFDDWTKENEAVWQDPVTDSPS